MDSIHIYFETRVLSVYHSMIDNFQIPLIVSFYCSLIMREQKMKNILISSVLDDGLLPDGIKPLPVPVLNWDY